MNRFSIQRSPSPSDATDDAGETFEKVPQDHGAVWARLWLPRTIPSPRYGQITCPRVVAPTNNAPLPVDSNHLRTTHAFKMPLHRYLENTLHGKVKPFITKCTLASILQTTDLHTSKRPDFLPPPTDVPLRHCSHAEVEEGGVLPEEDCLLDLLSGGVTGNQQPKNKQHFVLATADPLPVKQKTSAQLGKTRKPMAGTTGAEIRAYAREIPGVPIIYVKRSVMILEELSGASLGVRRRGEKDKFKEGLIGLGSRKRKRDGEEEHSRDKENQDAGEGDKAEPKKKKTKKMRGPNPLSVLKKKPKPKAQQGGAHAEESVSNILPELNGSSTTDGPAKGKRRRKHGKTKGGDADADADGAEGLVESSELKTG